MDGSFKSFSVSRALISRNRSRRAGVSRLLSDPNDEHCCHRDGLP